MANEDASRVIAAITHRIRFRGNVSPLDVHVLYNGEMLKMSVGAPVQAIDLDCLLKGDFTGGTFSPPPQS